MLRFIFLLIFGLCGILTAAAPYLESYVNTGDFNGDGLDDAIRQRTHTWNSAAEKKALVFLSNGDGSYKTFDLPDEFGLDSDHTKLYIGDFDGDGKDDFLKQQYPNTVSVFLSNGDGTFTEIVLPEEILIENHYATLYIGDFDGDGKDDFLKQEYSYRDDELNSVSVFLSDGNGTFTEIVLPEEFNLKGDRGLLLGDFNGDRKTDFLYQAQGYFNITLYQSNGRGFEMMNTSIATFDRSVDLYVGDFNKDGRSDCLKLSGDTEESASIFLASEDGATFTQVDLPYAFGPNIGLYVADFTGDGKADFLQQTWDLDWSANYGTAFLAADSNNTFIKSPEFSLKGNNTGLVIGDFNGDGKADFFRVEQGLWNDNSLSSLSTYFSLGDGSFNKVVFNEPIDPKLIMTKSQIKTDIARNLQTPLATVADYLGYGWAGGCYANVGKNMIITEDGDNIIIASDGCTNGNSDGEMSDVRLKITLADWTFIIKDLTLGDLLSTEKISQESEASVVENDSDETIIKSTTISRAKKHEIAFSDLHSLEWQIGEEASYTTKADIAGSSWSLTLKGFTNETDIAQTGQIITNGTTDSLQESVTVTLPPRSKAVINATIFETKSNFNPSVYVIEAQFSVQYDGFLKSGDNTTSGGNFHRQYRDSEEHPLYTYKFGEAGIPFYEQLQQELASPEDSVWDWNGVQTAHPFISVYLDWLLNKAVYSDPEYFQITTIEGTELRLVLNKPEPLLKAIC